MAAFTAQHSSQLLKVIISVLRAILMVGSSLNVLSKSWRYCECSVPTAGTWCILAYSVPAMPTANGEWMWTMSRPLFIRGRLKVGSARGIGRE